MAHPGCHQLTGRRPRCAGSNLLAITGLGKVVGSIALGSTTTRFATPAQEGGKVFVGTTIGIVAIRVG